MTERAASTEEIRITALLEAWADAVRRYDIPARIAATLNLLSKNCITHFATFSKGVICSPRTLPRAFSCSRGAFVRQRTGGLIPFRQAGVSQ
jgi:hypothetical protein